jgi:hypothetical protein
LELSSDGGVFGSKKYRGGYVGIWRWTRVGAPGRYLASEAVTMFSYLIDYVKDFF